MLSVAYVECHLCWVLFMLSVTYANCCLCWLSLILRFAYAECLLCWVSHMLSLTLKFFSLSVIKLNVIMLCAVVLSNVYECMLQLTHMEHCSLNTGQGPHINILWTEINWMVYNVSVFIIGNYIPWLWQTSLLRQGNNYAHKKFYYTRQWGNLIKLFKAVGYKFS